MLVQGHGKAQGLVCQVMATGSEPLGEYQRKTQSPQQHLVNNISLETLAEQFS